MAQQLHIAKSGARNAPTLPLDAITRTFGIFGVKDSGKTTTARVLVEAICKAGGNVAVLDPVGVWWGATRAGEGPGIPGIVLGGEHGDVPLEETGGQLVAELVVGRHYPLVVIDLKLLRKGQAQRFMADFLEGVYFHNRRPLMLVFEEADRALPQTPRGMDPTLGRVLGAAEDIVKLGRSRGLGSTFISQRFATVQKNVTEQVEALILHRQVGPNDRKAVKAWIESNGDVAVTAKVLDSMASLEQGEAWLYSPGWLRLLERVRMRAPRTLDSSATPSNEQAAEQEAAKRAPVDLDVLRQQMAETVERAEANDPRKLRERIEELEAAVEEAREQAPAPERVLVPDREAMSELAQRVAELDTFADDLDRKHEELKQTLDVLREVAGEARSMIEDGRVTLDLAASLPPEGRPADSDRNQVEAPAPRPAAEKPAPVSQDGISPGAERLLGELRELAPLKLTRTQLATILRRGAKSSTLTQQLGELVGAGHVERDPQGRYGVAGDSNGSRMSRAQLVERWRAALPDGPRALFDTLLKHERQGGAGIDRALLFRTAGFSPTSSTPVTHLKLLTDNDLAERQGGIVTLGPAVR